MEINALQHGSTIIMQKSLKEGFGLTVSEGMWKGKPVVASAVGGIVSQVHHGITGELIHSESGAAQSVKKLLVNPAYAKQLGVAAKEHVRNNFLLTRRLGSGAFLFSWLGCSPDPKAAGLLFLFQALGGSHCRLHTPKPD